ncbi:hypothetical protein HO133_006585 [Letharia lupina]|uniref:Uncharacterized protein n=1 Tax=Letharia lupina TaxID=560253 RepID=A0A8H6F7P0_9LECA|nr:uncharacterized protein HO133_006585 [Letharia lupina]KAF6217758.1 hypothetical protein HO133_006585 [Letharia lupina]
MGCTSSKESAPRKSKRVKLYGSDTQLPDQRYLSDPLPNHVVSENSSIHDTRGSGEAARPKETFEAYVQRGVIRQSALAFEGAESKRAKHLSQKKRVGGYEKYTQE